MNSSDFKSESGLPRLCLGNPAHRVKSDEDMCRICGILAQDALVGAYQAKHYLGRGRGYHAYLATQLHQAQPVLMKIFPPNPINHHLWEKAWQEMKFMAGLHHSAIFPVLGCMIWNPGRPVSTGPLADASTTENKNLSFLTVFSHYVPSTFYHLLSPGNAKAVQARNVPVKQLLRLVEQAAAALATAHDVGIVHGALEPGNLVLGPHMNQLWIADFGIARLQPPLAPFLAPELMSVCDLCKQRRDVTPYWEAVAAASDQYALATLCYQLFRQAVPPATFQRILPVIQHASQADPALRFRHIVDFSRALAAEFEVGLLSGRQQPLPLSIDGRRRVVSESLPSLPAFASTPTASQQVNQLEQMAGKRFLAHDYQGAEQAYVQASRLDPTRASAWQGLADTYFALERYTDALEAYAQALDLEPNNADAWFSRATILDLLGQSDQAARAYERAEQLRTESAHHPE